MGTTSRTVAVVNGSHELLGLFHSLLGSGRYQVSLLETSDRAYSRIKDGQPNLVIFFLRVAERDDFDVLSMLKLDPATGHIPILTHVLDAGSDDDQEDEAAPDSSSAASSSFVAIGPGRSLLMN